MGSCATGTCERSKKAGGEGCYMCDVVAVGRVNYKISGGARGSQPAVIVMKSFTRIKDDVNRREESLTRKQATKAAK